MRSSFTGTEGTRMGIGRTYRASDDRCPRAASIVNAGSARLTDGHHATEHPTARRGRRAATNASALSVVVFDLDGVLLDSRRQMQFVFTTAFERHGTCGPPPLAAFFAQMGRPLEEIVRSLGLPPEFADSYRQISRASLDMIAPYEGVADLLDCVRGLGCTLGLLTGKDRVRTAEVLGRFGLERYFPRYVCGDDPCPPKPHPAGLQRLLRQLSAEDRSPAAFVGDTAVDMACATRAAILPIGAEWGIGTREELERAGAARTFSSPDALRTWFRTPREVLRPTARVTQEPEP
jgi:phosphoglycolate phosphatase-like HAD superfamily hydrolase